MRWWQLSTREPGEDLIQDEDVSEMIKYDQNLVIIVAALLTIHQSRAEQSRVIIDHGLYQELRSARVRLVS